MILEDSKQRTIQQSITGILHVKHLPPGQYSVVFEDLPGYVTPPPIEVVLKPNEHFGPIDAVYESELPQLNPLIIEEISIQHLLTGF
jgi:hypothetical protein